MNVPRALTFRRCVTFSFITYGNNFYNSYNSITFVTYNLRYNFLKLVRYRIPAFAFTFSQSPLRFGIFLVVCWGNRGCWLTKIGLHGFKAYSFIADVSLAKIRSNFNSLGIESNFFFRISFHLTAVSHARSYP